MTAQELALDDRRRRTRNLAMLVVLVALSALFYVITLVKVGALL
ncbi:MAG TPA: hypothetical protein VL993_14000 [Stellaceae bacterium]|nr:hypothetical protein [Stellaceae bacterium]